MKRLITAATFAALLLAGRAYGGGIMQPGSTTGGAGCNTVGAVILKGDGAGGCANAVSGTDYETPAGAQTKVDTHVNDATAAHAATAVSVNSTNLDGVGVEVQTVLEELETQLDAHITDATAAHAASAISVDSTNLDGVGTNAQTVLEELEDQLDAHKTDATDAHAGNAITNTPAGNIEATTIQAAIDELDTEKLAASHLSDADPHTQYVFSETVAGAPGAGTCDRNGQIITDTTNEVPYFCSDGNGGNPRSFATLGDSYNQISDGSNSAVAVGSETLKFASSANIAATVTAGSPDQVSHLISVASQAQGDVLYYNGTNWVRLAAGVSGQFLKTNGAGANPAWADAAAAVSQLHVFRPQQGEPPAANFATLDTRNSRPILSFIDATDTSIQFSGVMNRAYSGGDILVDVHFMMPTVTTNAVGWCARIEASVAQDQDSDGFPAKTAGHCASTTVAATAGLTAISTITLTNAEADAIAAGGEFVLEISRDADGSLVTDSATETAQFRMVELRQ